MPGVPPAGGAGGAGGGAVLVTGANSGLGFECCRQLASVDGVRKVILACRSEQKAKEAVKLLREATQKPEGFYRVLVIDVASLDSVRKAVEESSALRGALTGLILNAGGMCGADADEASAYGVPNVVAANLLGHVMLVDLLMNEGKLADGASVVFAGNEGAQELERLSSGSVDEFISILDGSRYRGMSMYYASKLMGAFWMASMSRKHSGIRFVTMSPGATSGTAAFDAGPCWLRNVAMPIFNCMGQTHGVECGAKRLLDALLDTETYKSGAFYASKSGGKGDVVNFADRIAGLDDSAYQINAFEAVHKFAMWKCPGVDVGIILGAGDGGAEP